MSTRRDFLASMSAPILIGMTRKAQGLILPGGASGATGQTFDYYISTTGSSGNPGTLASPWDINSLNTKGATYAGKRVGLLPGTYSVSSLMGTNESVAALELTGGSGSSNKTYIGSSNSSGSYSPRTATIDGAARAAFTADVGASATATFNVSMTAHSTTVTLSNVSGTVQAGMMLSGGTLTSGQRIPSPVYLVSGSGTTWTSDYSPAENWSATGMTGTVATLSVDSLSSGAVARGMVLVGTGLPAGAMVTSGSGTSWTIGASIASPLSAVSIAGTVYGGDNNNLSAIMAARAGCNYWTVDGLVFTCYSMWAFHVGDSPSGGACPISGTIQNCEFTGGNCSYATQANFSNGVNCGMIIVYASVSGHVTNSYFHGNVGNPRDTQHWSWIYQWGLGNTATAGNLYDYNTVVNSGNFQGKEAVQYNTEIAYNYMDMTGQLASSEYTGSAIFGCMSDSSGVGSGTKWHHNVLLANNQALDFNNTNPSSSYVKSPLLAYNNTIVLVGSQCDGYINGGYTGSGVANQVTWYNNLHYNKAGIAKSQYGWWLTNTNSFALCDYNVYDGSWSGSGIFNTVPAGSNTSSGLTAYSSLAAWATAIGGLEAHSTTSTSNPFTGVNTGTLATKYQLASGYAHRNFGRVGGVSTGAACDVGAWDGAATQVGCNFA